MEMQLQNFDGPGMAFTAYTDDSLKGDTNGGMVLLLEQAATGKVFVPRVFSGLIGEIFTSLHRIRKIFLMVFVIASPFRTLLGRIPALSEAEGRD
jgi:hypothetical protein